MKRILIMILLMVVSIVLSGCVEQPSIEPMPDSNIPSDATGCSDAQKAAEICTMEWAPVCGQDGKTHGNECGACSAGNDYWFPGECPTSEDALESITCPTDLVDAGKAGEPVACTREYMPICGDNTKTYSNKCTGCSSGEILHYTEGACKQD